MAYIECEKCGFSKRDISNEHVGKSAKCPKCKNRVHVDVEDDQLEFDDEIPTPALHAKAHSTSDAPKQSSAVISTPRHICPNCQSDQIRTVRMAYESGISTSVNQSSGIGFGFSGDGLGVGFGGSGGQSLNVSVISQKLAPPQKKAVPTWVKKLWWVLWPVIIIMPLFYARWNNEEYPKLMAEWEQSWICYKCGNIFVL